MMPQNGVSPIPPIGKRMWTRAAYTTVLPDRWVAVAYLSGQPVERWGDLIPDPLPRGPSSADLLQAQLTPARDG